MDKEDGANRVGKRGEWMVTEKEGKKGEEKEE